MEDKPLTDAEIAELRQNMRHIEKVLDPEDAERIPRLLDEVTRARALLKRIEFGSETGGCPACDNTFDHKPGCELAALIGH